MRVGGGGVVDGNISGTGVIGMACIELVLKSHISDCTAWYD